MKDEERPGGQLPGQRPRLSSFVFIPSSFILSLLALTLSLLPAARGQQPGPPGSGDRLAEFREGTHVFRRILFDLQFTPLTRFDQLEDTPSDTLLVVLGDPSPLEHVPGGLNAFIRAGGAALVATDQPTDSRHIFHRHHEVQDELTSLANIEVDDRAVWMPVAPDGQGYRNEPDCPFVVPVEGASPNLFHSPQPDAPEPLQVATNRPARLRRADPNRPLPPGIHELARFAPDTSNARAMPVLNRFFSIAPLFAVGGEVGKGKGRVLILADHSVFINEMMLPTDNGNVEFTYNCLRWLQERAPAGEQARSRVLFVEEGVVRGDINIPLKDVPVSLADLARIGWQNRNQILTGVERSLGQMEQEDTFNRSVLGGVSPRSLWRSVLVISSLGLVVYGFYRVGVRGRFRSETAMPPLTRALGEHAPTAPLLEQRHQAQLRGGNLWEVGRDLTRRVLRSAGVPFPPSGSAGQPPRVVVRGGWWQRWRSAQRVRALWRLAFDPRPTRVSPRALRALTGELEWLDSVLADGTVQLK